MTEKSSVCAYIDKHLTGGESLRDIVSRLVAEYESSHKDDDGVMIYNSRIESAPDQSGSTHTIIKQCKVWPEDADDLRKILSLL